MQRLKESELWDQIEVAQIIQRNRNKGIRYPLICTTTPDDVATVMYRQWLENENKYCKNYEQVFVLPSAIRVPQVW